MKKSIIALIIFIFLATCLSLISRSCLNRMNQSPAQKAGDLLLEDVYIEFDNTKYKVNGYVKNQKLPLYEAIAAINSDYISFDGSVDLFSSSHEKAVYTFPFQFSFYKKDGMYKINSELYRGKDWIFELFYEFSLIIGSAYGDPRPLILDTDYYEVEFDPLGYPVGEGTINYKIKCIGASYICTVEISSNQPDIVLYVHRYS